MSAVVRVVLLLALWLLAWGDVSLANIVSGVVLAVVLLVAFPARRPAATKARVSPVGVAKLILYVLGQLIVSNVLVAREVLSPRSRIRSGVLAYPVQHPSDEVLSLVANVLALTPGTMTVEATRDPAVLYVHFLLLGDLDAARRTIGRLERLAVAALGGAAPPDHPATPSGGPT